MSEPLSASEAVTTAGPSVDRAIAGVGRSAMLLTVAVGLGQVFGIGRELFVAGQVGISASLDALLVALVVPTMLSGLLMSGSTTALVPAYGSVESSAGPASARRFVAAVLTWTALIGAAAGLAVVALGQAVITLAGPGLSPTAAAEGLRFLAIVAPIIVLAPLAGLVTALCQVGGRFLAISVASICGPIVSFVVTVAGWGELGLTAMALGTSAGALASLVVLLVGAGRGGLLAAPTLRARWTDMRDFMRHALPLWASSMTLQLNLLLDRAIASVLAVGSVSALRFGEGVIRIPLTSIGPAWGMVLYPSLVRFAQAGPGGSLGEAAVASFRYVLAIFVPLSAACAALAPLIVDVAYRRGAFGAEDAAATASVAAALAPLIALTMIEPIVVGAHNSRRRGSLLLTAGILNAAVHAVLNIALGLTLGVAGVALSTSVTMAVAMSYLTIRLAREEPTFDLPLVAGLAVRVIVASGIVAVPIGLWTWLAYEPGPFVPNALMLIALTLIGFLGYLLLSARLGIAEPAMVVSALRRRLTHPFAGTP